MTETRRNVRHPAAPEPAIESLHIQRDLAIAAPPAVVFDSILAQLGPRSQAPDGTPMPMTLEPWPGGRWYRDLGNDTGHYWAHVQVIKPPILLELTGPLFMSYPAVSHVQYRLTAEDGGVTRVKFTHQAIGLIDPEHRQGVTAGWDHVLQKIRAAAEAA